MARVICAGRLAAARLPHQPGRARRRARSCTPTSGGVSRLTWTSTTSTRPRWSDGLTRAGFIVMSRTDREPWPGAEHAEPALLSAVPPDLGCGHDDVRRRGTDLPGGRAAVAVAAGLLTACAYAVRQRRGLGGAVCAALTPWRTRSPTSTPGPSEQMARARPPGADPRQPVALLAGARRPARTARAAVAAAGAPDVDGGDEVAARFAPRSTAPGTRTPTPRRRERCRHCRRRRRASTTAWSRCLPQLNEEYAGSAAGHTGSGLAGAARGIRRGPISVGNPTACPSSARTPSAPRAGRPRRLLLAGGGGRPARRHGPGVDRRGSPVARPRSLVGECARRGLAATAVSTWPNHIGVRTAYSPRCSRRWRLGTGPSGGGDAGAPRGLRLGRPGAAAVGRWRGHRDRRRLRAADRRAGDEALAACVGAALAALGLAAQLVSPAADRRRRTGSSAGGGSTGWSSWSAIRPSRRRRTSGRASLAGRRERETGSRLPVKFRAWAILSRCGCADFAGALDRTCTV